jgi:8-oxo-dGTP pyrophosphatase MutT (NUDIX family)
MTLRTPPAPQAVARLADPPDRDIASAVLIAEADGRYLLQLRDEIPGLHLSGHWGLFGGGLEPGETPEDAMRRELLEELGFAARRVEPLAVSIHVLWPEAPVFRLHFFAIPFSTAEHAGMVQREGAGQGIFTAAEACRLERVSPWDLCAILLHARQDTLFPDGLPPASTSRPG